MSSTHAELSDYRDNIRSVDISMAKRFDALTSLVEVSMGAGSPASDPTQPASLDAASERHKKLADIMHSLLTGLAPL